MALIEWVGSALVLLGALFIVVGGIGVVRFPDLFTRMHAASITETLGALLVLAGLILLAGLTVATVKLLLILLFLWFSSPTATHALAKAALRGGVQPQLAGEDESSNF